MTLQTTEQITAFVCIWLFLGVVFVLTSMWLGKRADKRRRETWKMLNAFDDLTIYDHLPPGIAVAYAWSETRNMPHFHEMMREEVRAQMPLLARSLDRLVEE